MSVKTTFAALLMFATSQVLAGDYDKEFMTLDANQDGAISAEEAKAVEGLSDTMGAFDLNGDAQLDKDEFINMKEKEASS